MRKPPTFALIAVLTAGVLILAACGGKDEGTPAPATPQMVEVETRWASGTAVTLPSLLQTSDEVFFGRVTSVIGQQETAVGPGSKGTLPVTSFEVSVVSNLSGSLATGSTVVIEQVGGATEISGGAQANIVLEGDERLEPGIEYLFFADRKPNGTLTSPPFGRLQVGADGGLTALPRWSSLGALQQLAGLQASAAAARVGTAK